MQILLCCEKVFSSFFLVRCFRSFCFIFFISQFPFLLILCHSFYFTYEINVIWQAYKMVLYGKQEISVLQMLHAAVRAKVSEWDRGGERKRKREKTNQTSARTQRQKEQHTRHISESLPAHIYKMRCTHTQHRTHNIRR